MSEPCVRAVPGYGGWEGHFRKVHRSGWHSVEVNGVAQLYPSPEAAKIAAYEAREKHLFGDGILRDGEKVSLARGKAEAEFSRIFPGKGKRPVVVERR